MSFDFGDSNNASDPTADFTSKFPSLDGDDGDAVLGANSNGASGGGGIPPALDEFENDLLGNGGAGAGGATTNSASLGDFDSPPPSSSSAAPAPQQPEQPKDDREQFESQFPELDDPDMGGAGDEDGFVEAQPTAYNGGFMAAPSNTHISARGPSPGVFGSSTGPAAATVSSYDDEEEPDAVREWRHKQGDEIARRDAETERKKGEAISQAERDIDQFYSEYNAKKEKTIKKNKEDEAAFLEKRSKDLAQGTTWDRVTKLIDLENSQSKTIAPTGAGSTDLSRFREILLSLRREGQSAPAAGGY
ncbi:unnamed protein product [Sympodiomycopsis kandeliae]